MKLERSTNIKGVVTSNKARTFYSESKPGWTLGSISDATNDQVFEKFRALMFQHEVELESYAIQFGTATHRQAFNAWDSLYERLLNEVGIKD